MSNFPKNEAGEVSAYLSSSAGADELVKYYEFRGFNLLNAQLRALINQEPFRGKISNIGGVIQRNAGTLGPEYTIHVKVIIGSSYVILSEPHTPGFPSEVFKTKLLLIAG